MPSSIDAASRRRQTRLRREYIYRKSLEGREKAAYEQKRVIREALASGKPLPTEVRASYDKLSQQIDAEDIATEKPKSHVDNEYGDAGLIEPRVSFLSFKNSDGCFYGPSCSNRRMTPTYSWNAV
jgi:U3 small nucleolar ribonucleoprotein protein IMP4